MAEGGNTSVIMAWVTSMLIFGTCTAVCAKTMFQTCAMGLHGREMPFNRPWMQTMLMFCAMTFGLFVHYGGVCLKQKTGEYDMLNPDGGIQAAPKSKSQPSLRKLLIVMVPSVFDLFATTLSGVGLLWVDASVYQMLRGSLLIFSAFLSIVFLGKKLKGYHWAGITITICAVTMVGTASVKSSSGQEGTSSGLQVLGIILIICGQMVQASQIVVEEVLLGGDFAVPALVIVGMEGFWGVLWMMVIMLIIQFTPGYNDKCINEFLEMCSNPDTAPAESSECSPVALYHEDTEESLHMIGSESALIILTIIYLFAILMYNVSGMNVTAHLSAIHRTILEACRTLCIWLVQLFIFYVVKWEGHGEEWNDWSFLQAGGFVVLIIGTLTYNKILKLPGFHYDPPTSSGREKKMPQVANMKASPRVANALPSNASPMVGQGNNQFNYS